MNRHFQAVIPSPAGWLLSPERDFVLFFIIDPESPSGSAKVITQLWFSTKDGIPIKLKNSRKVDLNSAIETWNELLSNDWNVIERQFNEQAA